MHKSFDVFAQYSEDKGISLGNIFNKAKINAEDYSDIIEKIVNTNLGDVLDGDKLSVDKLSKAIGTSDSIVLKYATTLKDTSGNIDLTTASTEGLSAYLKSTGQSFDFAAIKATLFNTALNAGIMLAFSIALQAIIKGIDSYVHRAENAINLTDELKSTHAEAAATLESHKKTVDELASSYEKLSKGVDTATNTNLSLSDEDYKEYLDITNQLAEAFPSLQKALDDSGNAILTLGQNGQSASQDLEDLLLSEEDLNNFKISQDIGGLFGGVKVKIEEAKDALEDYSSSSVGMEQSFNTLKQLSKDGIDLFSGDFAKLSVDTATEGGVEYYNALVKALQNFNNELDESRRMELNGAFDPFNVATDYDGDGIYDFYFDALLLSDKEKEQLQNEIKAQTADVLPILQDEISSAFTKQAQAQQEAELAWKDFLPSLVATMKSQGSFKALSDGAFGEDIQNFAIALVSNLDSSIAEQMDENKPYAWVRNNIILPLSQLSDEDRQSVVNAYNKLLELNPDDLAEQNQYAIDELIRQIAVLLGKEGTDTDIAYVRLNLGFEVDEDYKTKYDEAVKNAIDKFGSSKDEIQEIFTELGIDTSAEIDRWNEIAESVDNATEAKKKYVEIELPNAEEPKWDYSTTIENLDAVKQKLSVLDQSFAKLFDNEQIGFEDLSSIHEAFSDLGDIDDYIKRIQEAGQDTEQVSQIFGELTGAYLDHIGVLSNVTEENKELIISMLEEMGIANAEEIVLAQLSAQTEMLALQKQFAAEKGYELANASLAEAAEFINEANASEITRQALAQLALEKINTNNQQINTSGDIDNVIALANAAGASTLAIAKLKEAKAILNSESNGSIGWLRQYENAQATIESIENGTFDFGYKKLDPNQFKVTSNTQYTPKYTGGSNTSNAVSQAQEDAQKAITETESQFEETFDFFERRVQVLTDAFENLEKGMENVIGADAKNTLLSSQIGILDEEINNYTDALAMYRQKAKEALSGLDSDLQNKIINGAVSITDFVGDGSEEVLEAMKAYEGWADNVAECTQKLEELKTQIRQLELQKFNNIVQDFSDQFDIYDDSIDLIDKQIDLLEEAGELIGESYYNQKIAQSEKQLNMLEKEKASLVNQLNASLAAGKIRQGTDEWLEMVNALSDVEGNILDCKTAIEEFNNELLELNWKVFERVQTEFGNISEELDNLAGLFDDYNDIKVSDGKGTWTKEAIAALGLYAQQYELARYQVTQYADAIEKLKTDYLGGKYSATEYMDKLAELSQGQWDAVNSAEALEDAIIDLNETRIDEEIETIEDEIDAYKELIDVQIEALDAAKDLHDYEQSIAEKTKSVTDLERQLAAMQNDNTAATVAKRKLLEEELAEAKKELAEAEYEHSVEVQKDALNQQYEDYENARNAEIETLRLSLEERELLIAASLETVKANSALIGEQIALIAQEHGIIVSEAVITPWQNGENAIASYGEMLSVQSSAFIESIIGVESEVYNLQTQADIASLSLATMFAARADNLVNELVSSYYTEANLNAMTNVLQNSLVNTLERGYDISGITSALNSIASGANSVASAANNAASALAKMGAAQNTYENNTGTSIRTEISQGQKTYSIVPIGSNTPIATYNSYDQAYADWKNKYKASYQIAKYAKGGIVSRDTNGVFDSIAKSVGEDTMVAVKYGEGIFTPAQTELFQKLADALENPDMAQMFYPAPNIQIPQLSNLSEAIVRKEPSVNVHYDSLLTINGDVNDTDHFTKQVANIADKQIAKSWKQVSHELKY